MLDENILASLGSGYIRRADTVLPRQGRALPWRVLHNYELDRPMLLKEAIDDGRLEFVPASAAASEAKVSRSEEHTSELQSIMRISYAVFCLKKKNHYKKGTNIER